MKSNNEIKPEILQKITDACHGHTKSYLLTAINEAQRQRGESEITKDAAFYLSQHTLAELTIVLIQLTNTCQAGMYYIDAKGNYKIHIS